MLYASAYCAVFSAVAQDKPAPQRTINLPITEWLKQGEHQDIPWRIQITKPALTFQQRSIISVFAEVHSDDLQRKSLTRDLHFIVKVAGEDGKWIDDESYVPYHLEAKLDHKVDIQLQTELYLQQGNYTVATIVYDSVLGERNLSFSKVHVDPIDKDPFPQLLSQAPPIQFLPSPTEGLVSFGETRINLPVATQRPVQLDFLVDLSAYDQSENMNRPMALPPRRNPRRDLPGIDVQLPRKKQTDIKYLDRLIQTASMLSQLHLENGCTRVTAIDVLRRRVILPTTSETVEWRKIRQVVLGPDRNLISVSDLNGKREAPDFFAQQLGALMASDSRCVASVGKPLHVIAVLAHPVQFPFDHSKTKAQKNCDCDFFYIKQIDDQSGSDDLKGVLSPLSPKKFEFREPREFRRKLAELVKALQKASEAR
jgi:hypothetical protein